MRFWIYFLAACAALVADRADARDLLVLVENRNYRNLPDIAERLGRDALTDAAEDAGYDVIELADATARQMQDRLGAQMADLLEADRIVIVVAGHLVGDGESHWLLGTDAPRRSDPFTAGGAGLRVEAFLGLLARRPGAALLAVVADADRDVAGPGLTPGFTAGRVPQGVGVVTGAADEIRALLADDVLPGRRPLGLAVADRDLEAVGFLPVTAPLQRAREGAPRPVVDGDLRAWREARALDTAPAYRTYLDSFPAGRFREEAERRLAGLTETPEERAAREEAELRLSREDRRRVQRNLTVLGHDPRGIDGIFGPGTRGAIRSWQRTLDLPVTGYLSGNQVARLNEAAATRQAELEEEARLRREEQEREDAAFWRDTGSGATETGLRRYLERYPDGLFADIARDRLAEIDAERADLADAADRRAWTEAQAEDTVAAYNRYLSEHPGGLFRDAATSRIRELEAAAGQEEEIARARNAEDGILANPITRLLVERRLDQLGLDPGNVDGRFDEATRRAIRRYQRARDLAVTGYVDRPTLVRMLAGN